MIQKAQSIADNGPKLRAAVLRAQGHAWETIAHQVGRTRNTVSNWGKEPEFREAVRAYLDERNRKILEKAASKFDTATERLAELSKAGEEASGPQVTAAKTLYDGGLRIAMAGLSTEKRLSAAQDDDEDERGRSRVREVALVFRRAMPEDPTE